MSFDEAQKANKAMMDHFDKTTLEEMRELSFDELTKMAEQIKIKLSSFYGTKNVKDDWGPKSKKFLINIDQNKAQLAGISNQDIATSMRTVLDGFQTGEYRENDKTIPILMRSATSQEQTYESLETLNVYAQSSGKNVPLSQVADIIPQWQYAKIMRKDLASGAKFIV